MKLKLDDKNQVVVQDGKPVYVDDNGKDVAFDVPHAVAKIAQLNTEAKGHREAKEAAEAKLTAFSGLDPEAAKKALKVVENLDQKKLVDAGEVEKVKEQAIKAVKDQFEPQVKTLTTERDAFKGQLHSELIGGRFARSKFITDKLVIPSDLVQARFGSAFKIEEGNKVIGYDASGNKIFSKAKPGEVADFDEALEILVEQYPQRDHILKGKTGGGGGALNSGGTSGGKPTKTRAEFAAIPPLQQSEFLKTGVVID